MIIIISTFTRLWSLAISYQLVAALELSHKTKVYSRKDMQRNNLFSTIFSCVLQKGNQLVFVAVWIWYMGNRKETEWLARLSNIKYRVHS